MWLNFIDAVLRELLAGAEELLVMAVPAWEPSCSFERGGFPQGWGPGGSGKKASREPQCP